jgi:putative beta-lysine N-acetyltransferase
MQSDAVLRRGNSIVQHGRINNRVYVMKLAPADIPEIIRYAEDLTRREGYTKIFVKVPESTVEIFSRAGYITEAIVPFFFRGKEPAVLMAKYSDPARKDIPDATTIAEVLSAVSGYAGKRIVPGLPDGFSLMHATTGDATEIAPLYRNDFKTYPFPIHDPEYIRESMQGQIRYFIMRKSHLLAAVASCEIDAENLNAEVTDFATSPPFQGRGFAGILLHRIEADLKKEGILLAYTIARAISRPVNSVFAGAGYQYAGLLPNNTNICGSLESMNVWYKKLLDGK